MPRTNFEIHHFPQQTFSKHFKKYKGKFAIRIEASNFLELTLFT